MVRIYFLRHGQTDYNLKGIVQGSGVDSNLNDWGRAQAQAAFQAYGQVPFHAIYASNLKRTHQTLQPWVDAGHRFQIEAGVRELNWGTHEGVIPTPSQIEAFRGILESWAQNQLEVTVEGGENPLQAWDRSRPFFERALEEHKHEQILVCSHGRQIRVMLSQLTGVGLHNMEQYTHKNTGMSILEMEQIGAGQLLQLNDVRHLENMIV
ncbi:MAG: histidine phosphatase family protein [Bacteroidota bacterium]